MCSFAERWHSWTLGSNKWGPWSYISNQREGVKSFASTPAREVHKRSRPNHVEKSRTAPHHTVFLLHNIHVEIFGFSLIGRKSKQIASLYFWPNWRWKPSLEWMSITEWKIIQSWAWSWNLQLKNWSHMRVWWHHKFFPTQEKKHKAGIYCT